MKSLSDWLGAGDLDRCAITDDNEEDDAHKDIQLMILQMQ